MIRLESPLLRAPLLVATILATVATSFPEWKLEAHTPPRSVHLQPSSSVDLAFEVEASYAPRMTVFLDRFVTPNGDGALKIEVFDTRTRDGERDPCPSTMLTFFGVDGEWRPGIGDGGAEGGHVFYRLERCGTTGTDATITLRVTNELPTPVDFDWHAQAEIGEEDDDDEVPDDAFVRLKVVE